jgi:hypothetical protein
MVAACETHEIKVLTDLSEGTEGSIYQCVKCNKNFQKFNFKVRFENNDTIIIPKTKEERIP